MKQSETLSLAARARRSITFLRTFHETNGGHPPVRNCTCGWAEAYRVIVEFLEADREAEDDERDQHLERLAHSTQREFERERADEGENL